MQHGSAPLAQDTRGAQLVEYVIVIGAVGLIAVVGFRAFGSRVDAKIDAQAERVATLTTADGAPTSGDGALLGAGNVGTAQGAQTTAGKAPPTLLSRISSFFGMAAHAATLESKPVLGAAPRPPPPAATTTAAAPAGVVTENADTAFADFHGAGARKKGIGFWVSKDAGTPVAFGFTAGAAIDSDAATNVVETRAAFREGVHDFVDKHYQAGTTVKFVHTEPVLGKDGKPLVENGQPVTKQVRRPIPANEVPYIALPPRIYMPRDKMGYHVPGTGPLGSVQVRPGDYVRVTHKGTTVYAIFVDGGPGNEVGEVSMYLAEALGLSPNPNAGGIDGQEVTYEILPGSGPAIPVEGQPGKFHEALAPLTPEQIQQNGKKAFDEAATKKWVLTKP